MKKSFLIVIIVLLFGVAKGQISIEGNNSTYGKKFNLFIEKGKSKYLLTLKIVDSISKSEKFKKEHEILFYEFIAVKDIGSKKDTLNILLNKSKKLQEKYSFYSTYKLKIDKNKNLDSLVNLFMSKPKEDLERTLQNKHRIILDGTSFDIKVKTELETKHIYANNPDKSSHPEIIELITLAMKLFRDKPDYTHTMVATAGY